MSLRDERPLIANDTVIRRMQAPRTQSLISRTNWQRDIVLSLAVREAGTQLTLQTSRYATRTDFAFDQRSSPLIFLIATQVIIDNMMNLQVLFAAMNLNHNSTFRDIAISHSDHTIKNHIRADGENPCQQSNPYRSLSCSIHRFFVPCCRL